LQKYRCGEINRFLRSHHQTPLISLYNPYLISYKSGFEVNPPLQQHDFIYHKQETS